MEDVVKRLKEEGYTINDIKKAFDLMEETSSGKTYHSVGELFDDLD